jgi:hypothetical protein
VGTPVEVIALNIGKPTGRGAYVLRFVGQKFESNQEGDEGTEISDQSLGDNGC